MRQTYRQIAAAVKSRFAGRAKREEGAAVAAQSMLPCPEHLLIPYQTAALPPGPWLVFAPHADDETFGLGGSLLKASDEGIETHVVVVTDGAQGGAEDGLVPRRQEEARRAGEMLGLRGLRCWNEPDRGLRVDARWVELFAVAIRELRPASVFFPGPLEIHPDHRATGMLAWAALRSLNETDSPPLALSYEITALNPINRLIDITAQMRRKHGVMAVYVSQNSQNTYPEYVTALNRSRSFSLPPEVTHAEGLYQYDPEDLQQPQSQVVRNIIDRYFAASPE